MSLTLLLGSYIDLLDLIAFGNRLLMLQLFFFPFGTFMAGQYFPLAWQFTTNPLSITFLARADFRKTLSGIWRSTQCLINVINFIPSVVVQSGKIWCAVMPALLCPQPELFFTIKSFKKNWNNLVSLELPQQKREKRKVAVLLAIFASLNTTEDFMFWKQSFYF